MYNPFFEHIIASRFSRLSVGTVITERRTFEPKLNILLFIYLFRFLLHHFAILFRTSVLSSGQWNMKNKTTRFKKMGILFIYIDVPKVQSIPFVLILPTIIK